MATSKAVDWFKPAFSIKITYFKYTISFLEKDIKCRDKFSS